ncbi:helix-turn-helix transcriptional regulator [Streptomyces mobaraensis NBRC 13819 = DSM 40847]|uniref:helix-turn-helix domain-containing protein n=1 Tax=Streptomyces mobaraensis TaxID=35621 RepID=UPI0005951644|nr:helix-turn-helix transcriptional regulator [Streptomyces mobaraensis]QTT74633.1 helix-turn-helix transcriptional regulator [Streptomyces mobaraensis NBRC 13819 = DSM 40847]
MTGSVAANIRRFREQRGWSQARLAREVCRVADVQGQPVGRQEVSRWETGKRRPREWLPFISAALGVPVEALRASRETVEPPPPSLTDYLPEGDPLAPLGAREGRRVGVAAVADLQRRVHGLRLADDVIAGGDLLRPALREFGSAVRLFREGTHTEAVGRSLLRVIGELAQIAGWIASDAGRHAEAERIYRLGLSAAHTAEDTTLAGNLLGSLAYQRTNTGDVQEGLGMARAALENAHEAPPRARALYLDRVAWAHAKAGEDQAAIRAVNEAGEALAGHGGEDEPGYLYWVDAGELRVMEARVYTELRRPLRAVPVLRDVLGRYDATHTRELALYLSWLAVALTDANEPEEAAATAERVMTLSASLASDRTARRTEVVLSRLERFREVPEVRALLGSAA